MPPRVVAVDAVEPRGEHVAEAVELLRAGGVIALPTETFYGLAADAFHEAALGRLNRLKGKAADAPILLLLGDPGQVSAVARDLPPSFAALAARFWPGPLTLVVPAIEALPVQISAGRGTVAVRVPGLALPRAVALGLGRPITGVSANLHRAAPARSAEEALASFGEGLDLVLDGGPAPGEKPSTIVDLTGPRPRILRHGVVPAEALARFLPDLEGMGAHPKPL